MNAPRLHSGAMSLVTIVNANGNVLATRGAVRRSLRRKALLPPSAM